MRTFAPLLNQAPNTGDLATPTRIVILEAENPFKTGLPGGHAAAEKHSP